MLSEKWAALGDWSPLPALKRVGETKWLIDGIIPAGSINWMVAAPGSFKTFLALDMAACIASGRPWHGRETDAGVALYVAGEGGNDIHVRRAAADLAANDAGPLCVVQIRPRLDEPQGLASLLALVHNVSACEFKFPEIEAFYALSCPYNADTKYLTSDEKEHYDALRDKEDYNEEKVQDYLVRQTRPRFSAWDEAIAQIHTDMALYPDQTISQGLLKNIFLVIDTYSQTSADDAKGTSRYIKTLRDLQDKANALGGTVTILVIDHTTKSGDSYMGSLAKEGDSDTMIEVERHGAGHSVTLKCAKMKTAIPFTPIHLDLKPITLEGFTDAQGRLLTSLVVVDGEQAHVIRKTAGADKDTAAAVLVRLLTESGPCTTDELRKRFSVQEWNTGKKQETINRAFLRAFDTLKEKNVIALTSDDVVSLVSAAAEEPSLA